MTATGSSVVSALNAIVCALRADGDMETAGRVASDIAAIRAENPGTKGELALARYHKSFVTEGRLLTEEVTSFRVIQTVHA